MSGTANINKVLGKMSKHFCEQTVANSNRKMYQEENKKKQPETEEITMKEKLFKGQKLDVFFEGKFEDLSDLRLKVYVNGAMKFVSQADAFVIDTFRVPRVVRKGWFFTTIFDEKRRLKFKNQSEFERFQRFVTVLRDCKTVERMYVEQCYKYISKESESVNLQEGLVDLYTEGTRNLM